MNDLEYIFKNAIIRNGDGTITIKPFSIDLYKKIENCIVFINKSMDQDTRNVLFKNERFTFTPAEKPLSFCDVNEILSYELKIIFLCLIFIGRKQNFRRLKPSTALSTVLKLKRITTTLEKLGCKSLFDIESLSVLNKQKITEEYISKTTAKENGFYIITEILLMYGFISEDTFKVLKLNTQRTVLPSTSNYDSNSFPIIPEHTLLKTFDKIKEYEENFYKTYAIWKTYNEKDIKRIHNENYKVVNGEYVSRRIHTDNMQGFCNFLNKFKKVVFLNTLLFTGMRKDEVKEIRNTGLIERDGKYYITSYLGKTVDDHEELTWISSEYCNKLLKLLVDMNKEMHNRVKAIIARNDSRFSESYLNYLKSNLENDLIFGVNYSMNLCRFDNMRNLKSKKINYEYSIFKIPIDQHDIDQLNFLDCNYQSTVKISNLYMKEYKVGDYFNFTPHQFRHTFAFFMITNNLCSIQEIKHQFKHVSGAMSYIYSKRAIYSDIIKRSKSLDETLKIKSLMGFSDSIKSNKGIGGGVKYIFNALNLKDFKYNISVDPFIFRGLEQVNTFLLQRKDSINFLPHGFCMNGSDCSLKSISDPVSCINCHGYVTTDLNLPYWRGLLDDINIKILKLSKASPDQRKAYANLILNLEEKRHKVNEIINSLQYKKLEIIEVV